MTEVQEAESPEIMEKVNPAPWKQVPLVLNNRSFGWVTDKICGVVESKTPTWWWWCFIMAMSIASFTGLGLLYLVSTGVGVWGNNNPVNWGWAIVNFVFWIGIGHAGTLISAVLCLLKQKWRTSINRASEAMTVFAVLCAGIFPLFHVGRVWFAWWLFPLPNANAIWPQFRSPLEWDVFAVSTYATVSVLFWYMGMIPDMAVLRDRAKETWRKYFYGFFLLWVGEMPTTTGEILRWLTSSLLVFQHRWFYLFTRSFLSTLPWRTFQVGTLLFSLLISLLELFSQALGWF